ncbi:MAG: hypothetical protein K2W96_13200, partial [Gemmataceae bacterium]|nr:hypothetical protein [Gemmataceae bacterium]
MPKEDERPPLEGDWVEREIEADGVRFLLRVNWGDLEVRLLPPAPPLEASEHRRCWSFAVLAHHRPEERFLLRGQPTPKGVARGKALALSLLADRSAAQGRADAIRARCASTRAELAAIHARIDEALQAFDARKRGLRRRFRAGDLTQAEHQRLRQENDRERDRATRAGGLACQRLGASFADALEKACGRRRGVRQRT